VTTNHAREAAAHAEKDEVRDLIAGEPLQAQMTLLAVALLSDHSTKMEHTNDVIYRVYNAIAEDAGEKQLSQRRIVDILDELTFFELLKTTKQNKGYQTAVVSMRRPVYSPSVIADVICENNPSLVEAREHVAGRVYDYLSTTDD